MFNNISAVCRTAIAPGTAMRRQTVCMCADVYSLRSAKVCGASRATQMSASCCVMNLRHVRILLLSVASLCSAPCGAGWIVAINRRMCNPCAQHHKPRLWRCIMVCACARIALCAVLRFADVHALSHIGARGAVLVVCACAELCQCACSAGLAVCACAETPVCAVLRLPVCWR